MLAGADSIEQTANFLQAVRAVKRDDGSVFVERDTASLEALAKRMQRRALRDEGDAAAASEGASALAAAVASAETAELAALPSGGLKASHLLLGAVGFLFFLLGMALWVGKLLLGQPPEIPTESPITPIASAPASNPVEKLVESRVAPTAAPSAPPRASRRPTGTLSLVTDAPAKVFHGKRLLGTTPLLGLTLPAGGQRLILVEQNGKRRRLNVPITAGKNLPLNLALGSLPSD
jgi:serine/threonine-protein kinase